MFCETLLRAHQLAGHADFHIFVLQAHETDIHALFGQAAPIDLQFGSTGLADCERINRHVIAVDGCPAHCITEQGVGQFGFLEQAPLGGEDKDVLLVLYGYEILGNFAAFDVVACPGAVGTADDGDPLDGKSVILKLSIVTSRSRTSCSVRSRTSAFPDPT